MSECQILEEMIYILGPNGDHWAQNELIYDEETLFGEMTRKYCVIGAYGKATGNPMETDEEQERVYSDAVRDLPTLVSVVFKRLPPSQYIRSSEEIVYSFNDRRETTWEIMKEALEEAKVEACNS